MKISEALKRLYDKMLSEGAITREQHKKLLEAIR
jgi:hypothetical protein